MQGLPERAVAFGVTVGLRNSFGQTGAFANLEGGAGKRRAAVYWACWPEVSNGAVVPLASLERQMLHVCRSPHSSALRASVNSLNTAARLLGAAVRPLLRDLEKALRSSEMAAWLQGSSPRGHPLARMSRVLCARS